MEVMETKLLEVATRSLDLEGKWLKFESARLTLAVFLGRAEQAHAIG